MRLRTLAFKPKTIVENALFTQDWNAVSNETRSLDIAIFCSFEVLDKDVFANLGVLIQNGSDNC
jgi:hypothetical protein